MNCTRLILFVRFSFILLNLWKFQVQRVGSMELNSQTTQKMSRSDNLKSGDRRWIYVC
jgi:hypothetical protein